MSRLLCPGSIKFADDDDDDENKNNCDKNLLDRHDTSRSEVYDAQINDTVRELDDVAENPRRDGLVYTVPKTIEGERSERPYLSLFVFGWRVTYVTRRTYDVMPTLVRKAVDRLFSVEKRD